MGQAYDFSGGSLGQDALPLFMINITDEWDLDGHAIHVNSIRKAHTGSRPG